MVGKKLILITACIWFGVTLELYAAPLHEILRDYEQALLKVAQSNPQEAASALVMLAAVRGRSYGELRNRLFGSSDPEVQMTVVRAMQVYGDNSPECTRYLEKLLLTSNNSDVVGAVASLLSTCKTIKIHFADIWERPRATYFWSVYASKNGFPGESLQDMGVARPWNDPSWKELSRIVMLLLLGTAGSQESITLLIDNLQEEERDMKSYIAPAESANTADFIPLLSHSYGSIRRYACTSLNQSGKSGCFDYVLSMARQGSVPADLLRYLPAASYADIDSFREIFHSPNLTDSDRESIFTNFPIALIREGRGDMAGLVAQEVLSLSRGRNRFTNELVLAIARNDFTQLPDLLRNAFSAPDPEALNVLSWMTPRIFWQSIPDNDADQIYAFLTQWLVSNPPNAQTQYGKDAHDQATLIALSLIGQVARGQNADDLWQRWTKSDAPLKDYANLIPVLTTNNRRSEKLGRILVDKHGLTPPLYDVLKYVKPETPYNNRCAQLDFLHKNLTSAFWFMTEEVSQQTEILNARLSSVYGDDELSFAMDFLQERGITPNESASSALGMLLNDGPDLPPTIKSFISNESSNGGAAHSWRPGGYFDRVYLFFSGNSRCFLFRRINKEARFEKEWTTPGPELTSEDEQWIRNLLAREEENAFQQTLDSLRNPHPVVGFEYSESIAPRPPHPAQYFFTVPPEFLTRLDALKNTETPKARNIILWNLWRQRHDPAAENTWLNEARSSDHEIRLSALQLLAEIKSKRAGSIFVRSLTEDDPQLRIAALIGIKSVRMMAAGPDVILRLTDSDKNVQTTAIWTLGVLHSKDSRVALVKLLDGESELSSIAANQLRSFNSKDDIESLIHALTSAEPNSSKANLIQNILCELTFRCRYTDVYSARQSGKNVEINDWTGWWKTNKNKSPEEWWKEAVQSAAQAYIDSDPSMIVAASYNLASLLPTVKGGERNPNWAEADRKRFAAGWSYLKDRSAWEMIHPTYFSTTGMDLLMRFNKKRVLGFYFPHFLRKCRYSKPGSIVNDPTYDHLIAFAGEDFGDICSADCDSKKAIVDTWIKWGKAAGLMR